eukprot:5290430-Amphidinium_carterae.1
MIQSMYFSLILLFACNSKTVHPAWPDVGYHMTPPQCARLFVKVWPCSWSSNSAGMLSLRFMSPPEVFAWSSWCGETLLCFRFPLPAHPHLKLLLLHCLHCEKMPRFTKRGGTAQHGRVFTQNFVLTSGCKCVLLACCSSFPLLPPTARSGTIRARYSSQRVGPRGLLLFCALLPL